MTKVLSRLVWWRCVLAVFLAGAPVVSWASFTDLDGTIGYGDLAAATRSTDLRSHYDRELRWRIHRLELLRPSGAATPGSSPTASPTVSWGRFGYGWRGHEGEAADGAKVGRLVTPTASGVDLGSGLGWSWGYDAGVRLSSARAGSGSLDGSGGSGESWRLAYREGDELERIVREATGEIAELESGVYGRILARDGVAFAHDGAGRRTLDDRFRYRWNWRGELVEVEVLAEWSDAEVTPWAGHLIEYRYDASGRMSERWHWGAVPEGGGDRPFIERRVFVWEEARLAAEAAYGLGGEETLRWRRTYVPGPSGLDDAPQVVVEIGAIPGNPFSGTARTYTYLRDELGTVIGLIAEDEGSDPSQPPAPVRYRYSPYGEAHAEAGPRLEAARFAEGIGGIESIDGTAASQNLPGGNTAAAGALVLALSAPLDPATLAAGLVVERLEGTTWTGFDVTLGHLRPPPGTVGNDEPDRSRLILLPSAGWPRGTSYRVRLGNELRDHQGLPVSEEPTLQWTVPAATGDPGTDAVGYEQIFPVGFETWQAAGYQLGGRFPGGQNSLFQGLWTDPITGIAHARARWYDARNAAWLSEDPLKDVDSVNLYAFVGWRPNMGVDPLGLRDATLEDLEAVAELDDRIRRFEDVYAERGVAGTTFLHGRMEHTRWWDPHHEEEVRYWKSYIAVDDESFKRLRAALHRERDSYVAAVEEADDAGEVQYSTVSYNYYTVTEEERAQATRQAAVGQLVQIGMDLASARGARGGRSSQAAARQRALPAPNRGRLPQDVAVNSASPRRLPLNRPIGESAAQRTALREDIRAAQQMGARDIRVNQQQVNAAGERVGRNRPDLQYTRPDGTRVYIEYDTATPGKFPNTPRGRPHADRILANDPNGVVELRTF